MKLILAVLFLLVGFGGISQAAKQKTGWLCFYHHSTGNVLSADGYAGWRGHATKAKAMVALNEALAHRNCSWGCSFSHCKSFAVEEPKPRDPDDVFEGGGESGVCRLMRNQCNISREAGRRDPNCRRYWKNCGG